VIQKRLVQKDGRFEVTLFSGAIPNDDFQIYFPLGGRVSYYITEDIALEMFGSYMLNSLSDLADRISQLYDYKVNVPQSVVWTAGLDGLWSPLHGKLGFLTWKLVHFDWHISMGVGAIGTEIRPIMQLGKETAVVDVAGNVGTGLKLFFNNNIAVRLDYRQYFFPARKYDQAGKNLLSDGAARPAELTIGVSYFFD